MELTTTITESLPDFYCVGVDLGSVNDSTAIAVVEVAKAFEVTHGRTKFQAVASEVKRVPRLHYTVRLLHRPRLGTEYPLVIQQIAAIIEDLPPMRAAPVLAIDATGLGQPIVQLARQRGLKPIGVAITAGNNASIASHGWSVPKALLVGELRLAMHQRRLSVAQFGARDVLERELSAFTAKLSASGRASFEAAGSEHDDSVLALALATFAAKHRPAPISTIRSDWMAR
ncbi:hypothetical protein [Rhodopila sp.]|uniref:hypothetical protein n=1 Tax=Rhodopila sp. TaxID=2480087 RepID=UPI003D0ECCE3